MTITKQTVADKIAAESPDFLCRGTGEGRLATTLANLRRNVLDQHAAAIDREHLAHELFSCGSRAAVSVLAAR